MASNACGGPRCACRGDPLAPENASRLINGKGDFVVFTEEQKKHVAQVCGYDDEKALEILDCIVSCPIAWIAFGETSVESSHESLIRKARVHCADSISILSLDELKTLAGE